MSSSSASSFVPNVPHGSTGDIILGVYLPITVISFLFVAIRLYTRVILCRFAGADDILIAVAWLLSFGTLACVVYGVVDCKVGKHVWDVTAIDLSNWLHIQLHLIWVHQWALAFTHISILTFYLRVWPTKTFRFICFLSIAMNVVFGIVMLAINFTICDPIERFWNPLVPGTCRNPFPFFKAIAILNVVLDLQVYVLPFPQLRKLKVNKKQKMALYLTFGLGAAAITFSVVRVYFMFTVNEVDITYKEWSLIIWSGLELNIGIICACVPSLKALIRKINPNASIAKYYKKAVSQVTARSRHDNNNSMPTNHSYNHSQRSQFLSANGARSSIPLSKNDDSGRVSRAHADATQHIELELSPFHTDFEIQRPQDAPHADDSNVRTRDIDAKLNGGYVTTTAPLTDTFLSEPEDSPEWRNDRRSHDSLHPSRTSFLIGPSPRGSVEDDLEAHSTREFPPVEEFDNRRRNRRSRGSQLE